MRRAVTTAVLSAAAMVALAACGGGSSSGVSTPTPTPPNPKSFSFNFYTPAAAPSSTMPLARKITPAAVCHMAGQHGVTSKDVPYTCVRGHWVADKVRP